MSVITVDPAGFDTGDIYMQKVFDLGMHEMRGSVAERLAEIGSSMVEEFFDHTYWNHKSPNILLYSGGKKIAQSTSGSIGKSKARKLLKSRDTMVAWDSLISLRALYNRWRALGENIGCWTLCFTIYKIEWTKGIGIDIKIC